MSIARNYLLAFTLMLMIYAVTGAAAWRLASPAVEALRQRAEQIEQAYRLIGNQ
jgi:hypothetical protein